MNKPKLGTGARMTALEQELSRRGARDPQALAASIGAKKYGKARMQAMASASRSK